MKINKLIVSFADRNAAIKDGTTDAVQYSRLNASGKLTFAIAALAGLALASGCSTSQKSSSSAASTEPAPAAVGSASTPGGQSAGYASSSTQPIMVRSDAITDPGALPNGKASGYNGSFVYFNHMTVRRVFSDYALEVSDDQGPSFYVLTGDTSVLKPGDVVLITGILRDDASYTTALVRKQGSYMMHQPYYIEPERIVIVQK